MPPNGATAGGRGRSGGRRRLDDDSAYIGASGLGRKRGTVTTTTTAESMSMERAKRKRVEGSEKRPHFMDFASLPPDALHRYLIAWDVVPAGMMAGSVADGVLADVHEQMARAAERHFMEKTVVNEIDVLTTFLLAVNRKKFPGL